MSNITYGYKDFGIKFLIIFNGIIFIFLLNFSVFAYFMGNYDILYFIVLIISGVSVFFIIRLVNNLKYEIDNNGITIITPGKRKYLLEKKDIEKIDYIGKVPFYYGLGIRVNFITGDVMFTTSLNNIYRINMFDGKKILISPKNKDLMNLLI
ncbi:hypothetical protein [Candidatus Vampirococcus lugosii]|uniref:Bacterial Pleckstrin homology domain-containing protein n=1 Tax=Candidatus Vampirococcus lugosii TaxID=2789015 RepID=A0ABS5QMT0_9BACT|nr:hypothetical protein [Candidatus Vampirococcus lugosii]MBS8122516.1 hypothetical protein [Candidatus Vampirococcus lugosii]